MTPYSGIRTHWYSLLPYLSSTHIDTGSFIPDLSSTCQTYITHTLSLLPSDRQTHLLALALAHQRAVLQTHKARVRMCNSPTDPYDVWAAKASLDEVQRDFDFRYRSDGFVREEAVRYLQKEEGDRRAEALGRKLLDLLRQTEALKIEVGDRRAGSKRWATKDGGDMEFFESAFR